MSLMTYGIEMKIDCDEERHEAMVQIMVQFARDWMAASMLLSQGKNPQLICRTTDAFYDEREIDALAEQFAQA
jgi:hypothetical protein